MISFRLPAFGERLYEALPSVEVLHQDLMSLGFRAWSPFWDGRIMMLPEADRACEQHLLGLLSREEFCNFHRYSRDFGGDGYSPGELKRLRVEIKSQDVSILSSDTFLRRNIIFARSYIQDARVKALALMNVERQVILLERGWNEFVLARGLESCLKDLFKRKGFDLVDDKSDYIFSKKIASCASVQIVLTKGRHFLKAGWLGGCGVLFRVRWEGRGVPWPGGRYLPLRVAGLFHGVDVYSESGNLFGVDVLGSLNGDSIVYRSCNPTNDGALALSQILLVSECFMAMYELVEPTLVKVWCEFLP